MPAVDFPPRKRRESLEETRPDRAPTSRAAVPPDRHRTEPEHSDDAAAGRHYRHVAARRGQPPARGRTDVDADRDGGGSPALGRRASSATRRAPRAPLGKGERLLRGGRAEGAVKGASGRAAIISPVQLFPGHYTRPPGCTCGEAYRAPSGRRRRGFAPGPRGTGGAGSGSRWHPPGRRRRSRPASARCRRPDRRRR